ncbi:hypothetical protein CMUS01_15104 [Colletotrichum musicola]|uniref:Uncharacterized protein n=1 Tax=Colletotrichum musicola TaxID=2175873 RepID=A0A8H6IZK6_9PEZI|nr:hypothetical protein CMUS01_15104 [Colletotrichum musicola]
MNQQPPRGHRRPQIGNKTTDRRLDRLVFSTGNPRGSLRARIAEIVDLTGDADDDDDDGTMMTTPLSLVTSNEGNQHL